MLKLFLFILLSTEIFFSNAQTTEWAWAKNAGGYGNSSSSVTTDASGNIYLGGNFSNPSITFGSIILKDTIHIYNGNADIFLVKYDSNGNSIWAKSSLGNGYDYVNAIATDPSGNIYVTGVFTDSSITFGSIKLTQNPINSITEDIFLVKYDHNGNVLWATSIGDSLDDVANSMTTDASGNIYMTGYFNSPSITFGSITLTNDTSSGSSDVFVVKYDTSGKVVWAKSYGGSNNDNATSITTDAFGNIYMAGYFTSPSITFGSTILTNDSGDFNLFITKCDTSGTVNWAINTKGDNDDIATSITADALGNIYLTGDILSPLIIFGSDTLLNEGYSSMFLAKYNANGNVQWVKGTSGNVNVRANSVIASPLGNIYVTGVFYALPITFDTITITKGSGGSAIFIVKYDSSGKALWAYSAGGEEYAADDVARSVTADASGNIYLAGDFTSDSLTFGNTTLINDTNIINADMFLAKIGSVTTGINHVLVSDNQFSIYPNPTLGQLTVQVGENDNNYTLEVYNIMGEQVYKSFLSHSQNSINLSNQPAGMYFVYLKSEEDIEIGKVLITK